MNRATRYALAAFSTFFLGIAVFNAVDYLNRVESLVTDWLIVTPKLEAPAPYPVDAGFIDEQAIYRAVVQKMFVNERTEMVVIQAETTGCPFYENEEFGNERAHLEDFSASIKRFMPTVQTATLEDYLGKNKVSAPLLLTDPGIDYVLLGHSSVSHFFDAKIGSGWRGFYSKYPRSTGLLFFSRVGFNPEHNQAFLYAGQSCGGLCGFGSYVLLTKQGGQWAIEQEQWLWES